MTKRQWFREQVKRELKQHKGIKGATKRKGYKPTLNNMVMLAMGIIR